MKVMKKQSPTAVSLTIAILRYARDHAASAVSKVSLYALNLQSIVSCSHHRQQYFHNISVEKTMRVTLELHILTGNRSVVDI